MTSSKTSRTRRSPAGSRRSALSPRSKSKTTLSSSADLWRIRKLPALAGTRPAVSFRADLSVSRGKLHSGSLKGTPVHAASFLRRREIILDTALRRTPGLLARIFVHEVFHFVWLRLSNASRRSYEELLAGELHSGARGELGWSAEWRKNALKPDQIAGRSRAWREYVCESFCDTAAWLYSGVSRHAEITLARSRRERRQAWMEQRLKPPLPI